MHGWLWYCTSLSSIVCGQAVVVQIERDGEIEVSLKYDSFDVHANVMEIRDSCMHVMCIQCSRIHG